MNTSLIGPAVLGPLVLELGEANYDELHEIHTKLVESTANGLAKATSVHVDVYLLNLRRYKIPP